jgi:hypothetical protein
MVFICTFWYLAASKDVLTLKKGKTPNYACLALSGHAMENIIMAFVLKTTADVT